MKIIPYEIHITVADMVVTEEQNFVDLCISLGGKPILIELDKGEHIKQPMFTIVHNYELPPSKQFDKNVIVSKGKEYAASFKERGYTVNRVKIEIPAFDASYAPKEEKNYYEWHAKVKLDREQNLRSICEKHNAHLSHNSLKDASTIRFVTLREYGTQATFDDRIWELAINLKTENFDVLKCIGEYCIFDTNTELDKGWL